MSFKQTAHSLRRVSWSSVVRVLHAARESPCEKRYNARACPRGRAGTLTLSGRRNDRSGTRRRSWRSAQGGIIEGGRSREVTRQLSTSTWACTLRCPDTSLGDEVDCLLSG